MSAALSVTHAFLPPHPGPTVIANEFGANVGLVLLYGFLIAIPIVIIAGPIFTKFVKKFVPKAFDKASTSGSIASIGETRQWIHQDLASVHSQRFSRLF